MKYIHVDGDDGELTVLDELNTKWIGWVYEVPDDYQLVLTLEDLDGSGDVRNLVGDDPTTRCVLTHPN